MKLKIKNNTPPLILYFKYKTTKDLNVYISRFNKEPSETQN